MEWIQSSPSRFRVDRQSVDGVNQVQAEIEHSQDNPEEFNKTTKVFPIYKRDTFVVFLFMEDSAQEMQI